MLPTSFYGNQKQPLKIPKPELIIGFGGDSLTKAPFGVTLSAGSVAAIILARHFSPTAKPRPSQ